jgi:anti-sigma B factor antagonist
VPANRMSRRGRAAAATSSRSLDSAPCRVVARTERDVVHVSLFGEVDSDTVGQIREQIETSTAGAARVVLDLSGVTFLDSNGRQMVLETDAAARADGWELRLVGAPLDVQRIFDLTGSRARLPFLTGPQLAALLATPGDAPP